MACTVLPMSKRENCLYVYWLWRGKMSWCIKYIHGDNALEEKQFTRHGDLQFTGC